MNYKIKGVDKQNLEDHAIKSVKYVDINMYHEMEDILLNLNLGSGVTLSRYDDRVQISKKELQCICTITKDQKFVIPPKSIITKEFEYFYHNVSTVSNFENVEIKNFINTVKEIKKNKKKEYKKCKKEIENAIDNLLIKQLDYDKDLVKHYKNTYLDQTIKVVSSEGTKPENLRKKQDKIISEAVKGFQDENGK